MNSIDLLTQLEEIIRKQPEFCSKELHWIDNRKNDWSSDRIRVGVVGVTSSGKSTLINAILGTDILSSAVAPSSGQLVCCSYGDTPRIVVHFEDGNSRILEGKSYSQEALAQYSDERYNPKNQKGVLSIELTSPLFDLGKDVLLVDSPGLDAFGLEAHEQLTLESLVPTIDACIYVTTMKTNSDRKTREILNTVGRYHCPIVIVQNMLDAVRPSPSGDKTRDQVAHDHWMRMKRIVDGSEIEDKEDVRIIQLSAEYAKQWRAAVNRGVQPKRSKEDFEKSNYSAFVQAVDSILESQRPRIELQRFISVRNCIAELLSSIESKINRPAAPCPEQFAFEDLQLQARQHEEKITAAIDLIFQDYDTEAKKILDEVLPKNPSLRSLRDLSERLKKIYTKRPLDQLLADTNSAVNRLASDLTSLVSAHNSFVKRAADMLHIPDRDLFAPVVLHAFRDIKAEKKSERVAHLVEDSGLWGKAKRFFGGLFGSDAGYHTEYRDEVVVDQEKTVENLLRRLTEAREKYASTMDTWSQKTLRYSLGAIQQAIDAEEQSFNQKRAAVVEVERLASLVTALKQLMDQITENTPEAAHAASPDADAGFSTPTKSVEVSPYIGTMLHLSRYALRLQHQSITESLVHQMGCETYTPIIISWDPGSTEEFLLQAGIDKPEILKSPTSVPKGSRRCLFILVNTIQYGAALKQLAALQLNAALTRNDAVVWVVQDFQELLNGECAAEGLNRMGELSERLELPCKSVIYLLHQNPIYNLAFLKFQFNRDCRQALHGLIRELQTKYEVYTSEKVENQLGEILRAVHFQER